MNYLVAVLSDRIKAEAVYSALEKNGLPMNKVAILGQGYQSIDEYGLLDPKERTIKQTRLMTLWLVPFGFIGGTIFSVITKLDTFAWAGEIGNHVIGGLLGAVSGAMGSLTMSGGLGLLFGGENAMPYRKQLEQGKYLLVAKGSENLTRQVDRNLQKLDVENIQVYPDPSDVQF